MINGIILSIFLLKGHTEDEIIASANDLDVDLIAMALCKNGGNFDINQESITLHILQLTPCPVLASFTD
jgi:nucleotide-binding universal stress UspA family protein